MPNKAMDSLHSGSTDKDIQDAISAEIELCMGQPGADQKACAGKAYGMARNKTGKDSMSMGGKS